jgi:thiol-disulfide isomerase/thioredoxin
VRSLLTGLVMVLALAGAACSTGGARPTQTGADDDTWRQATLRDVVSGTEFRIGELEGKVVAIETMAIWCVTCRLQQNEARAALEQLDSPDIIYLSLDVDPNENAADLADYAQREGFGWRFAVAPPEVSRSLAARFGDQILSPPSTPLVVLDPDGEVVEQHLGIKSAADMVALFEEHLP